MPAFISYPCGIWYLPSSSLDAVLERPFGHSQYKRLRRNQVRGNHSNVDLTETGKDDTETAVVIEVKKSTDASCRLGPKRNSIQTTTDLTVKSREKPIDKGRDRLKVTNETKKGKTNYCCSSRKSKKANYESPRRYS